MSGRVRRLPATEGELVRAEVRGSQVYQVSIRGQGSSASVHCTCPMFVAGAYCKHIWATIVDVQCNPAAAPREDDPIDQASPLPPKARRRGEGPPKPQRKGEPEWVGRLSLMRSPAVAPTPESAAVVLPTTRQICYALSEEISHRFNAMVILLRQRDATSSGWSRLKRLRLAHSNVAELADPIDRDACAMLLGAAPVEMNLSPYSYMSDSGHDTFAVPRGAWRSLLAKLCPGGRCVLERDGESEPLVWEPGEPWILWMVGREADDSLEVSVELRRGKQVMSIAEPTLVLGGIDGVLVHGNRASAFDDRGATRWVSQFREEMSGREAAGPIKVPADDVPRFLDRLYLLPHLPEIDLPAGLARPEFHIEPVPHLELFSAAAQDPALSAGVPRSQVVARVGFAYDRFRVKPGQPGRFIPTGGGDGEAEAEDAPAFITRSGLEDSPASDDGDELDNDGDPDPELEAGAATDASEAAADADSDAETDTDAAGETDPANDNEAPASGEGNGAGESCPIRRDLRREQDALVTLANLGFRNHPNNGSETLLLPVKRVMGAVAHLLGQGWVVTADQRTIRNAAAPRLSIASGIDWFEVRGGVRFATSNGEQEISLPDLLAAARDGKTMITLDDGSQGLLPQEWLERHGLLTAIGKADGDVLRFAPNQAALLDALLDERDLEQVDARFEQARSRLRRFEGIEPCQPAPSFVGSLRPYQAEGLGWMDFLRQFGMGGVLADDMGLGKTIQVLAMLDSRYSDAPPAGDAAGASGVPSQPRREHRPSIIVVPRSVVFNWLDEARQFAPRLRVQAYTGAGREALREAFGNHDVIVTSYGLMRRDIAELRKHTFDYIVLDEAQAIKNPSSQSAKAARLIDANHRLALTGTPVENHLGDLWSIFEFLNPGLLGSSTGFGRLVRGDEAPDPADPDAGGPPASLDADHAVQVARALRPFILRRTKSQVLKDLPEKTEQTIVCELEPEQRKLYDQLREHYRAALLSGGANGSSGLAGGQTMMVLEALLRLRQASCHPGLIDPSRADEPSAKLETLMERLSDLIEEGHKALVFSQFTSMLALVRRRLDQRKIAYEYLDGQTRHRRRVVQRFQTDPACPLFLVSLKAGGLGLNLTAAEYVFILDPWWNPAVEAQAIDRTHRIGQTRHVFAYRLICSDTVEQRIAELQQKKKKLADAIVGGQENLLRNLTREDLEQLLS
ncbi:MAG: DEAD/DEAH box helicase [Planctomycetota bacterium]|nr:DEAD/DEAH box helicase [Planctomycetota bacterium]